MQLVVFDIDGTLLDNLSAEDDCFSQALCDGLELPSLSREWGSYEHVSDQGIAVEAYRRQFGAAPSATIVQRTIERFVALLSLSHATQPIGCMRGAAELLLALNAEGWAVALATGAWRHAATFKLGAAGLYDEAMPMATAEDGPARTDIVRSAIARAAGRYRVSFTRIVLVGDGRWDVATARAMALPFVGVAHGPRASLLRAAGAATVLADFITPAAVISELEQAQMPLDAAP